MNSFFFCKKPNPYKKQSGENNLKPNYDTGGVLGINKLFDNPNEELYFELTFDRAISNQESFSNSEKSIYAYNKKV